MKALFSRKLMKARGRRPSAFIVFECLETPMKHSHSFLKYYIIHELSLFRPFPFFCFFFVVYLFLFILL